MRVQGGAGGRQTSLNPDDEEVLQPGYTLAILNRRGLRTLLITLPTISHTSPTVELHPGRSYSTSGSLFAQLLPSARAILHSVTLFRPVRHVRHVHTLFTPCSHTLTP